MTSSPRPDLRALGERLAALLDRPDVRRLRALLLRRRRLLLAVSLLTGISAMVVHWS
jgi:uncharacterized protein involved in exopolysaccharide biosynthesis